MNHFRYVRYHTGPILKLPVTFNSSLGHHRWTCNKMPTHLHLRKRDCATAIHNRNLYKTGFNERGFNYRPLFSHVFVNGIDDTEGST